jgi:hypothetical protein
MNNYIYLNIRFQIYIMEPLMIIYISTITMLGVVAATKVCRENNKMVDINKKEHIRKKSFKHYHSH